MTFGEKVKEARRSLNLSQAELAEKTGISERSLYTYEQLGTIPRKSNIKKIADALNVTVAYLMDGDETDKQSNMDEELFLAAAKSQYGYKGAKEAQEVIGKTKALLAGGDLDDEAKDVFFRALMEVYLQSKAEASEKFTPKKYRNQPTEDK
jgi:transcriptional regulator with XRE-family HTH domain